MRYHLLLSAGLLAAWSCSSEPSPPANQAQEAKLQAARTYRLSYTAPEAVDSTTWRYQQVGWADKETRSTFGSSDSYGSSDYGQANTFNLVFFGPGGADAHLLLPHSRYRIIQIDTKTQPLARWPYIIYTALIADTNKDKELGFEDAKALLVSDRQGRNVVQITPDTAAAEAWQVTPPHLVVALRFDSNRNHLFESNDDLQWAQYDLRDLRAAPVPLLPSALRNQMQQQLVDYHVRYPEEN